MSSEEARKAQLTSAIERLQDMSFEELVYLHNAITDIKYNSVRAGKRPRKRLRKRRPV